MAMWSESRLPETLQSTAFAAEIDRLIEGRDGRTFDLTLSDPTGDFAEHRARMADALGRSADRLRALSYEPDPLGLPEARRAVADYYDRRRAVAPHDQIVMTASTSEAYTWLAKLLCDPGESILVPSPSYPLFEHLLRLESVHATDYRVRYDGRWHVDTGHLREALDASSEPSAVFCVSPNNPTGHALDRREFQLLGEICRDFDVPLVVDEVFLDFHLGDQRLESALHWHDTVDGAAPPLTIVLSGLSKSAGLPGAKLGWMVLRGDDDRRRDALERLAFIGDNFLSASSVTQLATPDILAAIAPFQNAVRERLRRNLDAATECASELPACKLYPVEGGWYAVLRVPRFIDEADFCRDLLARDGVLVQPGFFYELEPDGHLVVSLLPTSERFAEGFERLAAAIARHT